MQGDILSQLHDIQTPQAVGWWPLAWGWYFAAAIIIAIIGLAVVLYLRRKALLKAKKQALTLLTNIDSSAPAMSQVKQVNDILKRVVLVYAERAEVADLAGASWANWLNQVNDKGPQFDPSLLSLAYQKHCTEDQAVNLKLQTKLWIKANLPLKKRKEAAVV